MPDTRRMSIAAVFCAVVLLCMVAMPAAAAGETPPETVRMHVPDARLVGAGRLNVFVFDVYDAALYAPQGRYAPDNAFALSLTYLRDIPAKRIAHTSVEEMRRMGLRDELKLADWFAQMRRIFPDVSPGSVLTGVFTPGGETVFYDQTGEIGRIRDPEFGRYFFNIWLGDQTSAPGLRRKLLGTNG